ncbi:LysR family transcriptional regulator [Undibacterium rugosum]|uniref:LysR family transcriptional regulator n=1 Tax=Undibacterium rugosum TaxID=2762291 RepID=A0A923I292_9BURK|nr:LysR family transcriptional regulator [Undibacterium rugosum]MBC3935717.1 LysR family transcriptional regulator [Undibacterium rugosum]MBR7778520.1 LysR family transcriptional regulator [Undibacterium rugosum]
MRELSLDQLKTLIAIIDLGTFSAAAQALHLSQPTISLHISELEQRFDTPLLVRGGRRVTPTAAGLTLAEHGRKLLRDADEAIAAVGRQVAGVKGRVRLGASSGILVAQLPQVMETLGRQFPDIDVNVSITGSAETLQGLEQGTLDIGIVAMPQNPSKEITIRHWRTDPMMAFLPAAWQAPKIITPDWLADKALIFNEPSTHMYRLTMEWFAAAGYAPRAKIELNYTEAMKSLVAASYGAAILPLDTSDPTRPQPMLQLRPLRPALPRQIGIAHRPLSTLDGASRNFLAILEQFRQSPGSKKTLRTK